MKIPILPRRALMLLMGLLLLAGALTLSAPGAAQAQDQPPVVKSINGNLTEVQSGVEFTYTIAYRWPATVGDGENVVLTDILDPAISKLAAHVTIGTSSHVNTINYDETTGKIEWIFQSPLPAGSSGAFEVKVRFPNGTTPPNTVAGNVATFTATNDGYEPYTSEEVKITALAQCKWITDVTGPSTPPLNENVTYTARLNTPSPNVGALDAISPSTMSLTLPLGVTPADIVQTNGGTPSADDGITNPITVTWDASTANSSANFTRNLVIKYDSARFALGNQPAIGMTSNLTVVGGGTCGGTDTVTSRISPPTTSGTTPKSSYIDGYGDSINEIVVGREFYFTLDANYNGNMAISSFVLSDPLPPNFELTAIRLPTVNNGPSGNFINVRYRLNNFATSAPDANWPGSPFPAGTTTLPVSALGLDPGEYVSHLVFDFGPVPVGFSVGTNIRLYGKLITPGWNTPPATIGSQVCNTSNLTFPNPPPVPPAPQTSTTVQNERCVDVVQNTVRPAVGKSVVSGGSILPGGETTWQVSVSNHIWSDGIMKAPTGMDLLPPELEYVPGSFVQAGPNSAGATPSAPEVIPNFNGTGRTLLRWHYTTDFPVNTQSSVQFKTVLKPGTPPGTILNYANVSVDTVDPTTSRVKYISPVDDVNDLDGDNDTTDLIGVSGAPTFTVQSATSLDSVKWVKGDLDDDYSKHPDTGNTSPGGTADYKLIVTNPGNVPLTDLVLIDILPFIGDTGVTTTGPRDSQWGPALAGPVSAPAGVTVEYSIEGNPCREEMGTTSPFPAGCVAPNWSTVPPSDITTVRSLRFDFGSIVLDPLDEIELNWSMRAPVDAPTNGEIAWNSFGVAATRATDGFKLLPTEPNKVGIKSFPPVPAAYGDRVWHDLDRDGIQDPGEPGINGVRVELYRDNGDGISNPETDEYVGFTITTGDGEYLFTNLPPGDYFAVFFEPPTYTSSPADQGGDDAADSDGTPGTVRGQPALIAPVTTLDELEDDRTWDQGFYQPNPPDQPQDLVAAVGNYVWHDQNGDGIQNESASAGLNGITVVLYSSDGTQIAETVTANDVYGNPGYYLFDDLPPGDYYIEFVAPDGFDFTTKGPDGSSDPTDSDADPVTGRTETFTLVGGQYDPTWDAGMLLPPGELSLGDRVWFDADEDGIYDPDDGELGINGVRLNLYQDVDGNGEYTPGVDQFFASTTTFTSGGEPGFYEFTNLPPGDYIVQVDPSNFTAGGPLTGLVSTPIASTDPNDDVDDDNNGLPMDGHGVVSNAITLSYNEEPDGSHNPTLDFGFVEAPPLGGIGDRIWVDSNGDGVQDPGEPGIPGITVQLTPPPGVDLGNGPGQPITQVTGDDGKYLFVDLPEGEYTVTVIDPPAGMNNTGDPDGGFDSTSTYDLGPGEFNLDQDFGYQPYVILTPSHLVTRVVEGKLTGEGSRACYWITLSAEPFGDVVIDVDPAALLGEVRINKSSITLNSSNWNSLELTDTSNFLCVRAIDDTIDESGPEMCADKSAGLNTDEGPYSEECGDHKEFVEHRVSSSTPASTGYSSTSPWVNRTLTHLGRPAENYLDVLILDNDTAEVLITESFAITDLDEIGSPVGRACYWITLGSQPLNPVTITITPDGTEVKTNKTEVIRNASNWNTIDTSYGDTSNMVCVTPINENDIDELDEQCWVNSNTLLGQAGTGTERCGTHMGSIGHSVSSADPVYATAPFRNTNGPDFDNDQSTIDVLVRNDDVARLVFQPATLNLLEGTQAAFEVSLASKPKADVIVSNDTTELVFGPTDWNVPREITVEAPKTGNSTPEKLLLQYNVTSADVHFQNLVSDPVVELTIIPENVAGVLLSSTTISVSEGGQTSTYDLALTSQPKSDVQVTLSTDGQLTVEPATLTFTASNWNRSQRVTVRAVDDKVAESQTHPGRITHAVSSADGDYQDLAITDIVAVIRDNDVAAVLASRATLAVSEDGRQDATYDVMLQSQPTSQVVVKIDGGGQVMATPAMLIFTPANWNTPQAVLIQAVNDDVDEGATHVTALTHKSESADPFYNGYEPTISVTVTDDDVAGVTLSQTMMSLGTGETNTYTIVLNSRPTSGVVIDLVAGGNVVATGASCADSEGSNDCVVFTPDNWNVPQTVTVRADGAGTILHVVSSADPIYEALNVNSVLVNTAFRLFLPMSQGN